MATEQKNDAVVVRPEGGLIHPMWNDEEKALIRETVAPGLNDTEFKFFIYYAAALGMNPIAKEIYAIKYGSKLVPQVAIDGFLKHAQETGKFRGFTEPEITIRTKEGKVECVPQKLYDPDNHKLVAATIGIRHADDQEPTFVTTTAKEYAVYFGDKLSDRWQKAPASQLVKCCKALAIRTRFPGMGGAYLAEEMTEGQPTGGVVDLKPTQGREKWGFGEQQQEPPEPQTPEDPPPPDDAQAGLNDPPTDLFGKSEPAGWQGVRDLFVTNCAAKGMADDQKADAWERMTTKFEFSDWPELDTEAKCKTVRAWIHKMIPTKK